MSTRTARTISRADDRRRKRRGAAGADRGAAHRQPGVPAPMELLRPPPLPEVHGPRSGRRRPPAERLRPHGRARATPGSSRRVLVAIFQRGAVDGLNLLVPYGEKRLLRGAAHRSPSRGPAPDRRARSISTGSSACTRRSLPCCRYFRDRSAAFVHAVGSPDATRSHFDAQDFMESGTPGVRTTRDGFLARALGADGAPAPRNPTRCGPSPCLPPCRGFSRAPRAPWRCAASTGSASGPAPNRPATPGVLRVHVRRGRSPDLQRDRPGVVRRGAPRCARQTLRRRRPGERSGVPARASRRRPFVRSPSSSRRTSASRSPSPTSADGTRTRRKAAARVCSPTDCGTSARRSRPSPGISDREWRDVTLVTISEFGRTVRENGNRGTDHGHANVMLLLGGGVRGGKVYGRWPGLDACAAVRGPRPRGDDRLPRRLRRDPRAADGSGGLRGRLSRLSLRSRPAARRRSPDSRPTAGNDQATERRRLRRACASPRTKADAARAASMAAIPRPRPRPGDRGSASSRSAATSAPLSAWEQWSRRLFRSRARSRVDA